MGRRYLITGSMAANSPSAMPLCLENFPRIVVSNLVDYDDETECNPKTDRPRST